MKKLPACKGGDLRFEKSELRNMRKRNVNSGFVFREPDALEVVISVQRPLIAHHSYNQTQIIS